MSLRLGIDLDGTVADLSSQFRSVEQQLFGDLPGTAVEADEQLEEPVTDKARLKEARQASRRTQQTWRHIQDTVDFWTTLREIEPGAVRYVDTVARRLGWDVVFITRRPRTAGASVQRQSQLWLAEHGFSLPSVVTLRGTRGRVARALELDVLLDDLTQNCVDVIADSACRPVLILRDTRPTVEAAARRLRIDVVRSVREAVDALARTDSYSS